MRFDDIFKREINTDELKEKIELLESEYNKLYDIFYSENKIKGLKEELKNILFNSFKEYFEEMGFKIEIPEVKNKTVNKFESKIARLGNYKVILSISDSYVVSLEVQSKKNYAMNEYRLNMDISNETEFESQSPIGLTKDLSFNIYILQEDIKSLNKMIEENYPLEVVCKFDDGQSMDMQKEYKLFEDIINDIPER